MPAIVLTAASKLAAVKSGSFVLAISSSCDLFTLPTLIVNTDPNYETDTEYSINDYALEKMNDAFNYLNDNQYSDAIINFNNSFIFLLDISSSLS